MKEYTVDCEKLVNPEATHTILAEIFAFPPYLAGIWMRCTSV